MPPFNRRGARARLMARVRAALWLAQPTQTPSSLSGTGTRNPAEAGGSNEQGSAVVEFTFLALLLMVPLVYFVITIGQLQGGSFAVVGAADQAAKVFVAEPDAPASHAAAEQAALIALADFGHSAGEAHVSTRCSPADCQAAGTAVTVTVNLTVSLPFVPFSEDFRLSVSEVEASSTQIVGRFR